MGFKMPHVLILVAIGCAGLALILQIVGVATPDWIKGGGTSTGLFKICSESKCVNIDDLPGKAADYVLACRAFGILGVLFLGGCVLVGALICFVENNKFPLIAAILGFVAGEMGFKMPHVLILVAIGCAGVALLLQIVGVATPEWIKTTEGSQGLFRFCVGSTCGNIDDYTEVPDYLLACRAFGILGVLVLGGCVLVGALICFVENDKFPLIAAILGFVAGVCCLIGFAVFAGQNQDLVDVPGFDYGYSFALTIVACILAFGAGVCFMLGRKKGA